MNRLGNGAMGIEVYGGASNNLIGSNGDGVNDDAERNVIAGNGWDNVSIHDLGTHGNIVGGNYIGVNAAGTASLGNAASGVSIYNQASNNQIGTAGTEANPDGMRNIIAGSFYYGIYVGASNNVIAGNYIGTNFSGTAAITNRLDDIYVTNASGNRIGTNADGVNDAKERNVISGSLSNGITIVGTSATNNVVAANYIGTDATGAVLLGNASSGVFISGASNNTIGGSALGAGNVIAGQTGAAGISISGAGATGNVVAGNYVGLNAAGSALLGAFGDDVNVNSGASSNLIGTNGGGVNDANERNVLAGASFMGVAIYNDNTNNNVVAGNYIGTDATGARALGNHNSDIAFGYDNGGIGSSNTRITGNVISGNSTGINLDPTTHLTTIAGNFIGTNAAGTASVANGTGIYVSGYSNTIGGVTAADRNVISGNSGNGVILNGNPLTSLTTVATADKLLSGQLSSTMATGAIAQADLDDFTAQSVGNWTINNPIPGGGGDFYAVKGAGTLLVNIAGTYSFALGSDDGSRLRIDGNQVVIYDAPRAFGVTYGTVTLSAGTHTFDWVGYQQGGGAGFELSVAAGTNTSAVSAANGWRVVGDNTLPGNGIQLQGSIAVTVYYSAAKNVVAGNYIGTNAAGTAALANRGVGVDIVGSTGNTIGGSVAGARNLISGNLGDGVLLTGAGTTQNVVDGNWIGVDVTGIGVLGNGQMYASGGVYITNGASNNLIGTNSDGVNDAAERNVISGNAWDNVQISGAGSNNNVIAGNYIGTDSTGMVGLGAGASGVAIFGGPQNNVVGTDGSHGAFNVDARNIISGNAANSVNGVGLYISGSAANIVDGNYIGLNASGTGALANTIGLWIANYQGRASLNQVQGNVISGNSGVGLEITSGSQNVVAGNYIGTNAAGTAAVGNAGNGVQIDTGSSGNTIGGTAIGADNLISGNRSDGVYLAPGTPVGTVTGIGPTVTPRTPWGAPTARWWAASPSLRASRDRLSASRAVRHM
ncbi:MAG TPA: hypothetical protein DDY78_25040 [Planctomycetales bacterium]|jgi:parallel beta-helix repeat protein|nr:hypothetical protein [Planctomycetales bacterium]